MAIAVIKADGPDDVARTRITREAQAMGRFGDHPNILQTHYLGEEPSTGSGQAPKIRDFGLAVVPDRSRITGNGMMVGTRTLILTN